MSAVLSEPQSERHRQAPLDVAPPPAEPRPAAPGSRERGLGGRIALQVALALTLLLVLLIAFAAYLYGLSGLSEHRAQTTLRASFASTLAGATAPIGPVAEGTPVAVLDIPQIGLHQAVVVEGTSPRDLTNGPGHRADTPLPGQPGVSVIYARKVTFGAPFAHLMRLRIGDRFTATTGQGVAHYQVSSFGDGAHPAPADAPNRIVLTTADSAGVPHSTVSVSASLVSKVQLPSGELPAVPNSQKGLATDVGASLLPALLWSQALLLLVVVATVTAHRWSPAATYLAAAPIAVAVLWNLFENLACLLPSLY